MGIGSRGEALKHRVLDRLGMSPCVDLAEKPRLDLYAANGNALHLEEAAAETLSPRLHKMLSPRLQRLLADASPCLERFEELASTVNARLRRNPKIRRSLPLVVGTAFMLCICGACAVPACTVTTSAC